MMRCSNGSYLCPVKSVILIQCPVVKECLDMMLATITGIANFSLDCGVLPSDLKSSRVGPLLRNPTLDPEQFNNYRPVSYLPLPSRIIEKSVALRLNSYMDANGLNEIYQSAYK